MLTVMKKMMTMMMMNDCFFCNCSMSSHLANWFNNELIISSLDFTCFRRKYTSSSMWAVNVLETSVGEPTTFSSESNTVSLNDLTSAKNAFFNLSKSSIRSSLKLLKFLCRFEFSIALFFLRERHALLEIKKQYNIWGFCMLERVTLQNIFYNIFAYTSVKGSRWSLVCAVTIRTEITECSIASRNRILLELLLREK